MSNSNPQDPVFSGFARVKFLDSGEMTTAKAPLEQIDPVEAYAPFVYANEQAAQQAIAKEMLEAWQMVVDGDLAFEDIELQGSDNIYPCDIFEDGVIVMVKDNNDLEWHRSFIFAAWDVRDPAQAAALAC